MEIKNKKQNFIGLAEIQMRLTKKATSESVNYNLHSLFSVADNYLMAQCLDVSMMTRIDINDYILNVDLQIDEIVTNIMHDIFILHTKDISNHFMACDIEDIAYPFTHASEKYWKEFRKIRKVRDNYSFNNFHQKSTSGIEAFVDIEEQIKDVLENMNPHISGSYKESFIPYVESLKKAA